MKFENINEIPVTISIPTIALEEFEERDSQNVTRQSRYSKNLCDGDLSDNILNRMYQKSSSFGSFESRRFSTNM